MHKRIRPALLAGLALAATAALGLAAADHQQAAKLRPPFGDVRATLHWPRTRTYDLQHVKVELGFDWEKKEIAGVATLTLAPLNDGLKRVSVDAAEMTIESVTLGEQTLRFDYDGQRLDVALDHAYEEGETFHLAVRYRSRPRKGVYFMMPDAAYPAKPRQIWTQGESEDTRYWIPLYDFPNERATSEMIVTVPAEMLAISNGRLLEARDAARGMKTYHWREDVPHVTYLISLIVGRFHRHSDSVGGPPLDYYVPLGTNQATVRRSFEKTPEMVRFFHEWIGIPYPYEKYAQTTVEEGLFGGMENISATTLYADTLHPEAAAPNWSSEGLVAHELAHQWWGNLLTCRGWSHIWLNEAFATFFTNLWFENRYGREAYDYRRYQDAQDYFKEDREEYRRPIVWPVYVNEMDLFDDHTYQKGAVVLDMLRYLLGDAAFQKALRHYGKKFAGQVVETRDLRQSIAEATGQELGWFFDQWLDHAGHPEFVVQAEWDADARQLRLTVEQKQELKELTPIFRLPVEVEFTTSQGAQTFRIEVAHAREHFTFPLPERPRRIRFDPGQRLLKKLEFARSRDELVDLLRSDSNVIGRIWAAEQLARHASDSEALVALREALRQEKFYGVRREIARLLGETRRSEARDALLEALRDADARVREEAAKALGKFVRDMDAARALENTIGKDEKVYVVAAALKSLGQIRGEGAFERLRGALGRDSHREEIRRGALEGFAELGDARALPLALEWSRYGQPPRAREAAIEALGKLGRGQEDVLNHLIGLLNDTYLWARRSATKALGELGDARAIEALQAVADTALERRVQREAEKALEKMQRARTPQRTAEELQVEVETLKQEIRRLRESAAPPLP
ncbi:MAG: HEAT repeat domain-containing protein [Acidobacteria bacterium]|nr:HEAT repeat domain-containing protein [Acidobacteriota bacterium]